MPDANPIPSRPRVPAGYGITTQPSDAGVWDAVARKIAASRNYWIASTRPDGRPHVMPVWGVWLDDVFYFSNGAQTARNLARDPRVSVNLGSGEDVVIVEGSVEAAKGRPLIKRINDAYQSKYLWEGTQDEWFALRPRVAFAWLCPSAGLGSESVFTGSATRWRFAAD